MVLLVPMCALYFVGVFASYTLVLHREGRRFPWKSVIRWLAVIAGLGALVLLLERYAWPLFVK
jgi:sec-independent protein translocase protein TatC